MGMFFDNQNTTHEGLGNSLNTIKFEAGILGFNGALMVFAWPAYQARTNSLGWHPVRWGFDFLKASLETAVANGLVPVIRYNPFDNLVNGSNWFANAKVLIDEMFVPQAGMTDSLVNLVKAISPNTVWEFGNRNATNWKEAFPGSTLHITEYFQSEAYFMKKAILAGINFAATDDAGPASLASNFWERISIWGSAQFGHPEVVPTIKYMGVHLYAFFGSPPVLLTHAKKVLEKNNFFKPLFVEEHAPGFTPLSLPTQEKQARRSALLTSPASINFAKWQFQYHARKRSPMAIFDSPMLNPREPGWRASLIQEATRRGIFVPPLPADVLIMVQEAATEYTTAYGTTVLINGQLNGVNNRVNAYLTTVGNTVLTICRGYMTSAQEASDAARSAQMGNFYV